MQAVGRRTVRVIAHSPGTSAPTELAMKIDDILILAIDLGKYKSIVRVYEPEGGEVKTRP
jgi:hypothetical protein